MGVNSAVASGSEGTCWFADAPNGCNNSVLRRVAAGATSVETISPAQAFKCLSDVIPDPRDPSSVLVLDIGSGQRAVQIASTGAQGALFTLPVTSAATSIGGLGVCGSSSAEECLELWITEGAALRRVRFDVNGGGQLVDTIDLPGTGVRVRAIP